MSTNRAFRTLDENDPRIQEALLEDDTPEFLTALGLSDADESLA